MTWSWVIGVLGVFLAWRGVWIVVDWWVNDLK